MLTKCCGAKIETTTDGGYRCFICGFGCDVEGNPTGKYYPEESQEEFFSHFNCREVGDSVNDEINDLRQANKALYCDLRAAKATTKVWVVLWVLTLLMGVFAVWAVCNALIYAGCDFRQILKDVDSVIIRGGEVIYK